MKSKDIKKIVKAVYNSDEADWKIRELSFEFLGKCSEERIDVLKDALFELTIVSRITPKKPNKPLITLIKKRDGLYKVLDGNHRLVHSIKKSIKHNEKLLTKTLKNIQ
jgi:SHS2 domain-containing protein